jgi:hypothetical protein
MAADISKGAGEAFRQLAAFTLRSSVYRLELSALVKKYGKGVPFVACFSLLHAGHLADPAFELIAREALAEILRAREESSRRPNGAPAASPGIAGERSQAGKSAKKKKKDKRKDKKRTAEHQQGNAGQSAAPAASSQGKGPAGKASA